MLLHRITNSPLLLATSATLLATTASAQVQVWTSQYGTTIYDHAWAVAHDGANGTFVGGDTWGNMFPNTSSFVDAWIVRQDAAGSILWGRQIGSSDGDDVRALASDGAGGVLAAGRTDGDLGGPPAGSVDAWVGRFDALGNTLWISQIGTIAEEDTSCAVSDGAGGLCQVTASFAQLRDVYFRAPSFRVGVG